MNINVKTESFKVISRVFINKANLLKTESFKVISRVFINKANLLKIKTATGVISSNRSSS